MNHIRKLDDSLINKIAAGEVIERPSSVVKELLENSIDAGCTKIEIDVDDAGTKRIRVSDDGNGMQREDLILSVERHTTSKLTSEEDLYRIGTLGFRGEALASIASVSRLTISSRTSDSLEGNKIELEGGVVKEVRRAGVPKGTTVVVSDLFFNTPARKKYLKSRPTELSHIIDIVTRYSLNYPKLSFKLRHNSRDLLSSPSTSNLINNISSLYGKEIAKSLILVDSSSNGIEVKGYVSKPQVTRQDRDFQTVFVNGRYVRNKVITDAVYDAYGSLIFKGREPIFILDIRVALDEVDVNVHPSKTQIKLSHEDQIRYSVRRSVESSLMSEDLIPEVGSDSTQENLVMPKTYAREKKDTIGLVGHSVSRNYKLLDTNQSELCTEYGLTTSSENHSGFSSESSSQLVKDQNVSYFSKTDDPDAKKFDKPPTPLISSSNKPRDGPISKNHNILGQIDKTYIIIEDDKGIILVDQHAAEERVNFEALSDKYKDNSITKQPLIEPIIVQLSTKQSLIVSQGLDELSRLGFDVEEYGKDTFLLRSMPTILDRQQGRELLLDLIAEAGIEKRPIGRIEYDRIATLSCRRSVKAGKELTPTSMKNLIITLNRCNNPYTCPHGRPTMIRFTIRDLEKLFKRVV